MGDTKLSDRITNLLPKLQAVANRMYAYYGGPVYLIGSAIEKENARTTATASNPTITMTIARVLIPRQKQMTGWSFEARHKAFAKDGSRGIFRRT
jgi:hypothetical protein